MIDQHVWIKLAARPRPGHRRRAEEWGEQEQEWWWWIYFHFNQTHLILFKQWSNQKEQAKTWLLVVRSKIRKWASDLARFVLVLHKMWLRVCASVCVCVWVCMSWSDNKRKKVIFVVVRFAKYKTCKRASSDVSTAIKHFLFWLAAGCKKQPRRAESGRVELRRFGLIGYRDTSLNPS